MDNTYVLDVSTPSVIIDVSAETWLDINAVLKRESGKVLIEGKVVLNGQHTEITATSSLYPGARAFINRTGSHLIDVTQFNYLQLRMEEPVGTSLISLNVVTNTSQGGSGGGITISGATAIGSVLTASVPSSFVSGSGQWYRGASAISGATGTTYTTVLADASQALRFRGSITSNTITADASLASLSIAGSTTLGSTLTATLPSNYTSGLQWYRGASAISGATGTTYTTVLADASQAITAQCGSTTGTQTSNTITMSAAATGTISIAGSTTIGSTLTATVPSDYTSGTIQWYRGASAISGATSLTYVTVTGDAAAAITAQCDTFRGHQTSNTITVDSLAPILLSVANNTLGQGTDISGSLKGCAFRGKFITGSGTITDLCVSVHNFALNTAGVGDIIPANSLEIKELWLNYNNTAYQCLFSGVGNIVLAPGAYDIHSDEFPVTVFGVSTIATGQSIDYKIVLERTTAEAIPVCESIVTFSDSAYNQTMWFDPTATTITNLNGTGLLTSTGAAPVTSRQKLYRPVLLGKFQGATPNVYGLFGDSIFQGQGDNSTAAGQWGQGYGARACKPASGTAYKAYFNWSKAGQQYADYVLSTNRVKNYYKYANVVIDELGTNDFRFGTTPTASATLAKARECWIELRAAGITFIKRTSLLNSTNPGTYSAIDGSDQTISDANWDVGGEARLFEAAMAGEVTAGRIDQYIAMTAHQNPSNIYKWYQPTTTPVNAATIDGLHPAGNMPALLATELRAYL